MEIRLISETRHAAYILTYYYLLLLFRFRGTLFSFLLFLKTLDPNRLNLLIPFLFLLFIIGPSMWKKTNWKKLPKFFFLFFFSFKFGFFFEKKTKYLCKFVFFFTCLESSVWNIWKLCFTIPNKLWGPEQKRMFSELSILLKNLLLYYFKVFLQLYLL